MNTLYLSHPDCLDHQTQLGHPERADRLVVVERALEQEVFSGLLREAAPRGDETLALLAHPEDYVRDIYEALPREDIVSIADDTVLSPGSWNAAMRALGACRYAVDEVMTRKVDNAFCAIRPPGHHAERDKPMGFCLFNNAAVAARYAMKEHGIERVAILDWDVHHGNGTQDIFWADKNVLYASIHEMPLFPGTGAENERGEYENIVNVPLHAGDGSPVFREALDIAVLPRIDSFAPDLIIISAGFDAHWRDPLANINLTEADFAIATRMVLDLADRRCGGRVVSILEGGYDLVGLSRSVAAHVTTLMRG
ncbi:acetoin utilization deacetylase AcuC-like enzyme [Pseudochelatococcus lubricantis]|uniref:Acetoin utilization deacetylase AcuC-like enzyme n=1 Tax=Pseudochelatococcus lubricantis TaxID=1538102 RepID=A0ABX0V4Y4_9HYPH|nr:histone deacetylase family protein [Pseudochelatococcus lubricantis]NIJ59340.1 acetoin utilization deacetylase AcuC-like enzyme [Pseudochelatococcus lubricantis]